MICIHAENVTINYCNDKPDASCANEVAVPQDSDDKESKPKQKES